MTFALTAAVAMPVAAQQAPQPVMGSVATHDALVTGGLEVRGERARLISNASVTAYDHAAAIDLERGGEVLVCATSQFHLLHSGTGSSLLFALDRGAVEIRTPAQTQDVVLTPDLRFTLVTAGSLDLRLRVTRDGDTCVDNAGTSAPVVAVSDAFSSAGYRLTPGQHVLFEHGDLHQVVDRETSSCGCPAPVAAVTAIVNPQTETLVAPSAVEARNPFPAAVSEGLAPEQPIAVNSAPVGEKQTQISGTLAYGGTMPDSTAVPTAPLPATATAPAAVVSTAPPPAPPGAQDLAHIVGRFFHKLFHRKG